MSWTVGELKDALENVPNDAVIHLQTRGMATKRAETIVFMERSELGIPALVMSPYVRKADDYKMVDGKIIDNWMNEK